MHEEIIFDDLAPVEIPVTVKGADGKERRYVLREATEGAAVQYRNAAIKAARMVDGKLVGLDGAASVEPLLVALCLFAEDRGGKFTVPVRLETVLEWKPRFVKRLFEVAKRISGLDETEKEEPQSDPTRNGHVGLETISDSATS